MAGIVLSSNGRKSVSAPQIRSGPTAFGTNGPSAGAITLTVPSNVQEDDYFLIITNNVTAVTGTSNTFMSPVLSDYSGFSTGSTYNENCTTHVCKIISSSAANTTFAISAGSFSFNGYMMVITNPSKLIQWPLNGGQYGYMYPNQNQKSKSTSSVTSFADTAWAAPSYNSASASIKSYDQPAGSIRIRGYALNGQGGFPNASYSGLGTFYWNQDSYWWRGLGVSIEVNASFRNSALLSCASSAVASIDLGFI